MCNLFLYQIILFIIFILSSSSKIIVLPFKILKKKEVNINVEPLTLIENMRENAIYTNILLGEPPKKINSIITFNIEDISMYHKINNNLLNNTYYNRNKSKTFEKINVIYDNPNIEYFKEQITFYTDLDFKNTIKVKDLYFTLIEYEKEKIEKNESNLCLNIGFKLSDNSNENKFNTGINTNIIMQLKQKDIISSYNFNIHFNPIRIYDEVFDGFIVLGSEPHQYLKSQYNEYQLYKTLAFKKDNSLSWDIHFNKIYYLNSNNNNEIIIDKKIDFYNQGTLSPSSSLIVGTNDYEKNIKFDYFDLLIIMGICKRENKNYMIFYYCYKDKLNKENLEKFPTLYFLNLELDYAFELNYQDLFFEKDNLVYFLVIFYDFPVEVQDYFLDYNSRWEFGTPFMKKYFFTYDYDNKYIGFYNNNKKIIQNEDIKDNNKNTNYLLIIIVIFLLIIFFGMFFIKKYVINNKKITAIELENNDKNNTNNYFNVEMTQKIIFKY